MNTQIKTQIETTQQKEQNQKIENKKENNTMKTTLENIGKLYIALGEEFKKLAEQIETEKTDDFNFDNESSINYDNMPIVDFAAELEKVAAKLK